MKKTLILLSILMLSIVTKAQDNPFAIIKSYDTLKLIVAEMQKMCPINIPGLGTCTNYTLDPTALSVHIMLNDDVAPAVMQSNPKTLRDNLILSTPTTDATYQLMKTVTDLGIAFNMVYSDRGGKSVTVRVTEADIARAKENNVSPLQSLVNFIDQINDEFKKNGQDHLYRVYYDDNYAYFEMLYPNNDEFEQICRGASIMSDEEKTEALKGLFEENAIYTQFGKRAANAGKGFALKYVNAARSKSGAVSVNRYKLKEIIDNIKYIK